jgi:hypothetical protein
MASPPVLSYIGRRAGVPAEQITAKPPLTPDQPRAIADSAHAPHVSDILQRPDEYRLSIESNPTVPVLGIYAVAPTPGEAVKLANASVDGLRDYLRSVAEDGRTPDRYQVRLEQLGRATGGRVDAGAAPQIAIVSFLLALGACCVGILAFARVRRGWDLGGARRLRPREGA